jgi:hypothetical protein
VGKLQLPGFRPDADPSDGEMKKGAPVSLVQLDEGADTRGAILKLPESNFCVLYWIGHC